MQTGTYGPWIVEAWLGQGGQARVARCRHVDVQGFRAAVKVAEAPDDDACKRHRQEIALLAGLQHPNIPRLIERGSAPSGGLWHAMELVEGSNLHALGQRERQSEDRVRDLVAQVGDALAYCHGRGVWHRDVKPANIVVREDGRAMLVDFGVARWEDGHGLTGTDGVIGTRLWISPERLAGDARVADRAAADAWSLGRVLYFLLTGAPGDGVLGPFDPEGAAPDLRDLCRRATDPEPTRRPPLEAFAALRAPGAHPGRRAAQAGPPPDGVEHTAPRPSPSPLAGDAPVSTLPVPEPPAAPPSPARWGVAVLAVGALLAVVLVVALGGTGLYLLGRADPPVGPEDLGGPPEDGTAVAKGPGEGDGTGPGGTPGDGTVDARPPEAPARPASPSGSRPPATSTSPADAAVAPPAPVAATSAGEALEDAFRAAGSNAEIAAAQQDAEAQDRAYVASNTTAARLAAVMTEPTSCAEARGLLPQTYTQDDAHVADVRARWCDRCLAEHPPFRTADRDCSEPPGYVLQNGHCVHQDTRFCEPGRIRAALP